MEEKKYLKWYNKVGYGSGDLAGNVVYAFLSSFVMLYLTNTVDLVWSSHFILCRLFPFYILFQNKADIIRMIKHLGDGYLKKTLIFGRNIIQGMCLVRGNDDTYYIIYHIVKF